MGAAFALEDDLGLFDTLDLLPEAPPMTLPDGLLRAQTGLTHGELLAQLDQWRAERDADPRWTQDNARRRFRYWSPAICGPTPVREGDADGVCRVTLWAVDLRCDHHPRTDGPCPCPGDYLHRAACPCGWTGTAQVGENAAVAEGLDHAFKRRWRLAPVLTHSMPQDRKMLAAWEKVAIEAYGIDYLRRGAPVITARSDRGTRSVPERTPWGGYDVGHVVAEHYVPPSRPGVVDPSLL